MAHYIYCRADFPEFSDFALLIVTALCTGRESREGEGETHDSGNKRATRRGRSPGNNAAGEIPFSYQGTQSSETLSS